MSFPPFFDDVPAIRLRDPLAEFLGASDDGVLTYHYADAVRLAGHSCPTVAGAWLMARAALAALYPDELPLRGGIGVRMPAPMSAGTTGVVAQILTLLTGAAADNGFHGLGGRFARNDLLRCADAGGATDAVLFVRLDNEAAVSVTLDTGPVPADPALPQLLGAAVHGNANEQQLALFRAAWQERVRLLLLEHADDPQVLQVVTH